MQINIREVEDGFISRWLSQSLVLIMKNPVIWIVFIYTLGCGALLPLNMFFKSLLGLWFLLLGLELAIVSDKKKLSIHNCVGIIKNATEGLLMQIYLRIFFFSLIFLVFILISNYFQKNETNFINDMFWLYVFGFLSLMGFGFQIFTHLFSRFFMGLSKRDVNYNCRFASKVNYKIEVFFEIFMVINIAIISYFFPLLVIMLYPITCSFVYVAFREIFVVDDIKIINGDLKSKVGSCEIG
jgi:hypothetical protein